ncbi:cold shock domain-containing protein [Amycolatopsis jejuensis]|uniref:cold shock domain-containing protein n=1 Tax=Amycolatopsis jejuensis TaxID=330084 RepID=UPI000524A01E|nr:cold shock domain-containing protein [Amycolatopsis jejuensis]
MEYRGKVVSWEAEEGWGVLETPTLYEQVWAHYSMIEYEQPGRFRELVAGAEVRFTAERAEQDGYHWRAILVRPA